MKCQSIMVSCPAPVATYVYEKDGLMLTFMDNSSNAPTSWLWTFGDGDTSILANPMHTYTNAGQYEVCLSSSSICGSEQICELINVGCEPPFANFSVEGAGLLQTFQDSSLSSPTSWLWTFGDGGSSELSSPTYTYIESGNYEVCLTVSNACGSHQHCQEIMIINSGINAPTKAQQYRVFPNPTKDFLGIKWEPEAPTPERLEIFNIQGQLLHHLRPTSDNISPIKLVAFPTGTYWLRIVAKGQGQWLRFIKE